MITITISPWICIILFFNIMGISFAISFYRANKPRGLDAFGWPEIDPSVIIISILIGSLSIFVPWGIYGLVKAFL